MPKAETQASLKADPWPELESPDYDHRFMVLRDNDHRGLTRVGYFDGNDADDAFRSVVQAEEGSTHEPSHYMIVPMSAITLRSLDWEHQPVVTDSFTGSLLS